MSAPPYPDMKFANNCMWIGWNLAYPALTWDGMLLD